MGMKDNDSTTSILLKSCSKTLSNKLLSPCHRIMIGLYDKFENKLSPLRRFQDHLSLFGDKKLRSEYVDIIKDEIDVDHIKKLLQTIFRCHLYSMVDQKNRELNNDKLEYVFKLPELDLNIFIHNYIINMARALYLNPQSLMDDHEYIKVNSSDIIDEWIVDVLHKGNYIESIKVESRVEKVHEEEPVKINISKPIDDISVNKDNGENNVSVPLDLSQLKPILKKVTFDDNKNEIKEF